MPTLQFELAITDLAIWKAAFDRYPINHRALGVRRHRVYRPLDAPNDVAVQLEFETAAHAEMVPCGAS